MDDLKIAYLATSSLTEYEGNARLHPKSQLKKLKKSYETNGFINPIIIDENGMVLAGHGRLAAARELGLKVVPTIQVTHLSEAEKNAYRLLDNKLSEDSIWSKQKLKNEFEGLAKLDMLEFTGFDTTDIDKILSMNDPEPSVDDDVELPGDEAPVCRIGDCWDIDDHRLAVGDARDPAVLELLMNGQRAQMIFCDPPYGVAIAKNVSGLGRVKHENFVMGAGETSFAEFGTTLLRPALKLMAQHSAPGAIAYIFCDWRSSPYLFDASQGVFQEHKNTVVWAKTNAGMGSFYRSAHELIHVYKVSPGSHINNIGLKKHRTNVWNYAGANVFRAGRLEDLAVHPTVKPKKLVADAILDASHVGGIVLDPFAGSGTTLVAAAMTRRRGYGVELDPKYADVVLRRVAEATGCEPTLDGVPLSVIAAERKETRRG